MASLSRTRVNFEVIVENFYTSKGSPVIFSANHSNSFDVPIIYSVVKRKVRFLIGKQRLGISDFLFFYLTRALVVDRLNRKDTSQAKKDVIEALKKGDSIVWFPEGTWNMTDSMPMLQMKWGIIECAKCAGAEIIPLSLTYDREKNTCRVMFGESLTPKTLNDKAQDIQNLRDRMASLIWEQIYNKGLFKRAEINSIYERGLIERSIKEYAPIDPEYEEKCVFRLEEPVKG